MLSLAEHAANCLGMQLALRAGALPSKTTSHTTQDATGQCWGGGASENPGMRGRTGTDMQWVPWALLCGGENVCEKFINLRADVLYISRDV